MPGQPAAARSWPGTWALAGLCGHLIQRPQQPQPAAEADFLVRARPGGLPESADDPKTAGRRLGPVQDDTDLHTPIVPAPAAGTISQLADARDAGAAIRHDCRDHRPQPSAPDPNGRRPAPDAAAAWKEATGEADPDRQPPPLLTRRPPPDAPGPIARRPSRLRHPSVPGLGGVPPADRSCLGSRGSPPSSPFPARPAMRSASWPMS
jgi:hypothetical protein